ncbi:MAG: Na/Pi cotransporter family protein [Candidatus Gastranaerophilales bacterium]|nr:Na/Pi cotransporter family protein [Candidatus Gastranaerophilales bacterium]
MENFDIFSIFALCGGLAFFLYGINLMSSGLEKVAGGKLEQLLKKMTSNPIKSFALGAGITAVIQSSSAVTVMLVGLVNSGIMELSQTVSVIIGSNVGTTFTAWILSLTGLNSAAGMVFKFLKPENFTPLLALIGIILIMGSRTNRRKNVGAILMGFAILMFGMVVMADSMKPLAELPQFGQAMLMFHNPLLGFLVGMIVTMIVQSSSASIGILQALTITASVPVGVAIPIILGQNLGTCISAILSAIGVSTNARRVAGVHVIYNILSVGTFLPIFIIWSKLFPTEFLSQNINPASIAVIHTVYNIITAVMFFPFAKFIEKLAIRFIPEKKDEHKVFLDERLMLSPNLAIAEAHNKAIKMASKVEKNIIYATKLLKRFEPKKAEVVSLNEEKIDLYEDKLEGFLIKVSGRDLEEDLSASIGRLLLNISDFERIGDHAASILKIAERMNEKKLRFSDSAVQDIRVIVYAVLDVLKLAMTAYQNSDEIMALDVEPLEQVVDRLIRKSKKRHIKRLQDGICTIELDLMVSDLFNDLERISDHCSNIATSILQMKDPSLDKHELINRMRSMENVEFSKKYDEYKAKYPLVDMK